MKPIDKDKLVKKPSGNGGKPVVNTPKPKSGTVHKPSFKEKNAKNKAFGSPKKKAPKKQKKNKGGIPVPLKIGGGVAAASIAVGVIGYAITNSHGNTPNNQADNSKDQGADGFGKDSGTDSDTTKNGKKDKKTTSKKKSAKKSKKGTDLLNDLLSESSSSKSSSSKKGTSSDELSSLIKSMSDEDSSDGSSDKSGSTLKQLAKKAAMSKENAEALGTGKEKSRNSDSGESKSKSDSSNELQQLAKKNANENKNSTPKIPGQPEELGKTTDKARSNGNESTNKLANHADNKGQSTTAPDHGKTPSNPGQPTTVPDHGKTPSDNPSQPTTAPDHGDKPSDNPSQPTTAPDHGKTPSDNPSQPTTAPDHGDKPSDNPSQPTTVPDHGDTPSDNPSQPTTAPDHGDTPSDNPSQPTTAPDHGDKPSDNPSQPTTAPDHGDTPSDNPSQPTTAPTEQSYLKEVSLNNSGDVLTGISNPSSQISVSLNGNNIGSAVANESGKFLISFSSPLQNGSTVHVTSSGNGSAPVSVDLTAQISQPEPSLPDTISFKCFTTDGTYVGDGSAVKQADGSYTIHTPNGYVPQNNSDVLKNQGQITVVPSNQGQNLFLNKVGFNSEETEISGATVPNATVSFTSNGTNLGSTTADGLGNFSFNLPQALTHGETVVVQVGDLQVNVTAPNTPYANINDGQAKQVNFVTSDGNVVGTGTLVKENGGFTLHNIPYGYKLSDEDVNGNSAQLLQWPDTITVVSDGSTTPSNQGNNSNSNPPATNVNDGQSKQINFVTSDGNVVGTGTLVKENGGVSLKNIPYGYKLSDEDTNGNSAQLLQWPDTITVVSDGSAAPNNQENNPELATYLNKVGFNLDGNTISGTTNPHVTVTFTMNGINLGSTAADDSGNFSFNTPQVYTHGETVEVQAGSLKVNAVAPTVEQA